MSYKKDKEQELVAELEFVKEATTEPEKAKKPVAVKPEPMMTFDKFFMSLGLPMHHKAGMAVYKNTKGKKTRETWEAIFASY